jgi:1,4-dihydroxy-2-naphthoyl-CoA hydrolase
LNYVLQIEIRLAVPNDVYFFAAQFSVILGAKIGKYYSATGISKSLMGIFKTNRTVQSLNEWSINTIAALIGIEFTAMGDDFLEAKMPVDHRTHQPLGLLHGGASVTLAETLGSVAATLCVDETKQFCVGLEINANHIRSVKSGYVNGVAKPVHIGKKTQVWEIRISTTEGELVCISRITMAVLDRKN